ncbi:thiol reductant ABC exporter subunit CydC [Streptococcus didelphis]|uniref:thiol reductant ABC exporter subunit CydC n=1 Tax=Streptococcus didelphis TaxID=102886 RepID=UPI00037FD5DD|nr:thiol reductant ABC exporter subunit CydC [Streptococcus didelphis]
MTKIPLLKEFDKDRWVKPFFKQYKKTLILALFLGFCTFFSASALMFNSGYLISKSASLPSNILLVYIPIVLTRAFGIGRPVFRYLERLTSHNWVLKMTSKLRLKLYQTLEEDAIFLKNNYKLGDIMGLLAEDINHVQNLYLRTIFPTLIAWLLYSFLLIALGFFSLSFAIFAAFYLGVLVFLFPLWSILVNGARQKREKILKNELYTDLTDNILGISDWIFSQRGHEYVNRHEAVEAKLAQLQAKMKLFNNRRTLLFELAFGLLAILVLGWSSSRFPGHNGGAANWIAAFVLSVFPLMDAFLGLSTAAQETNTYADSLKRLNALPDPLQSREAKALPKAPFDIEVKDLTFAYSPDSKEVLEGFSLRIEAGQKLAILGRSGSGKSTFASLLRGDLRPSSGQITLSGLSVDSLTNHISDYIGVIQQSPYLFNTSLLNNIRLGKQSATEEEIWQVLDQVGLKKMVEALPNGLETMVDEAGLRFSGGERHRLALARILLQETPIIILDEPTVGLDPITEKALLDTFLEVLEGKTLIWITHHLKGIEKVDRIIFIEEGQLALAGSPQELAQESQRYRDLKAIDDGQ